MRTKDLTAVLLACTAALIAAPAGASNPVAVTGGLVEGGFSGDDQTVRVYKGIPYAAPPVGDLRWKPPQPVLPWNGVRTSTEFSAECPQTSPPEGSFYYRPPPPQSEDCLYLNVWTAARSADERRPVMVWIHGGGLQRGSGSGGSYDGEALARKGPIVVTFNYRVNVFGFFAHPLLTAESPHHSSGNYGILDQVAALEWVRDNIAAFGGDPERVTIFGESAGGLSVCLLTCTPLSRGLLDGGISQSGAYGLGAMARLGSADGGPRSAEAQGERFARVLGIQDAKDPLAALRAKSADELIEALYDPEKSGPDPVRFKFNQCVDGWVFPDEVGRMISDGRQHDVPVLVGLNSHEASVWASFLAKMTAEEFRTESRKRYKDRADEFLALYPVESDDDVLGAYIASAVDGGQLRGAVRWVRGMQGVRSPGFLYYFTRVPPGPNSEKLGAYHAAEIPYVFDNLDRVPRPYEDTDRRLAETVSSYWVNFAINGNPNGADLPWWPSYDVARGFYIELGDDVEAKRHLHQKEVQFFESLAGDVED
jgi:para-nitrobenzyl esterase